MKINDFYQLMEELEETCKKYNMHITNFVAGETIELTIEKEVKDGEEEAN